MQWITQLRIGDADEICESVKVLSRNKKESAIRREPVPGSHAIFFCRVHQWGPKGRPSAIGMPNHRHADPDTVRMVLVVNSLCFAGLLLMHKCTIIGIEKMITFLDLHNYLNSNKTRPSAVQQVCSTQVSCLIYLLRMFL
jgi:hypothetical protein